MSRITRHLPAVVRGIRSVSSTTHADSLPSSLNPLVSAAHRAADLHAEGRSQGLNNIGSVSVLLDVRTHSTLGGHRPLSHPGFKPIPLMQGFRTSAPRPVAHHSPTIDCCALPLESEASATPSSEIRVPLLPHVFDPIRSEEHGHLLEELDAAVLRPQINVVAAHPENVGPLAMSEVVGNEAEDHIGQYVNGLVEKGREKMDEVSQPTFLKELWRELVEDIKGTSPGKATV